MKTRTLAAFALLTLNVLASEIDLPLHEFESLQAYQSSGLIEQAIVDGTLSAKASNSDPKIYFSNITASYDAEFTASAFDKIRIRMYVPATAVGDAIVYWGTSNTPGFSGTRSLTFATTKGAWQTYTLNMSGLSGWSGLINDIRLDPVNGSANVNQVFQIDYIRLITSSPGLSTVPPLKMGIFYRKLAGTDYTDVNAYANIGPVNDGRIAYAASTNLGASVKPLYRHYNGVDHMLSASSSVPGYTLEQTLGYVFNNQIFGTTPLWRQKNNTSVDYATVHDAETLLGYSADALLGYSFRCYNNSSVDLLTHSAGGITVGLNRVAGGTTWNWTWDNQQIINNYDLGRQLQFSIPIRQNDLASDPILGLPAESGWGKGVNSHGSVSAYCYKIGDTLVTRTVPVDNNQGVPLYGGTIDNPLLYSDVIFGKEMTLNYRSMGPVVKCVLYLSLPTTAPEIKRWDRWFDNHLTGNFKRCFTYWPDTQVMTERFPAVGQELSYGAFTYGASITSDSTKAHAFGMLVKHVSAGGSGQQLNLKNNLYNGTQTGEYDNDTFAQRVIDRTAISGAGPRRYTVYLFSGTFDQVVQNIDALYAIRSQLDW